MNNETNSVNSVDGDGFGEKFLKENANRYKELYSTEMDYGQAKTILALTLAEKWGHFTENDFFQACSELLTIGMNQGIPIHGMCTSESKAFKSAIYEAHSFIVNVGAENVQKMVHEHNQKTYPDPKISRPDFGPDSIVY